MTRELGECWPFDSGKCTKDVIVDPSFYFRVLWPNHRNFDRRRLPAKSEGFLDWSNFVMKETLHICGVGARDQLWESHRQEVKVQSFRSLTFLFHKSVVAIVIDNHCGQ